MAHLKKKKCIKKSICGSERHVSKVWNILCSDPISSRHHQRTSHCRKKGCNLSKTLSEVEKFVSKNNRSHTNTCASLCLFVCLWVPCPTPPTADKSLSWMYKTFPQNVQSVYSRASQWEQPLELGLTGLSRALRTWCLKKNWKKQLKSDTVIIFFSVTYMTAFILNKWIKFLCAWILNWSIFYFCYRPELWGKIQDSNSKLIFCPSAHVKQSKY